MRLWESGEALVRLDELTDQRVVLKRGLVGTWHKLSAKHLEAYLEEMTFRFNRRKRPDLFVDTLRHMVTAPVLTFQKLTADEETAA